MSPFKIILWIGLLTVLTVLAIYSSLFQEAGVCGIVCLETANAEEGAAILKSWTESSKNLPQVATKITHYDFVFLVFYAILMISHSSDQMNVEKNIVLNNLLRFNIVLAVITGLLDIAENFILLRNIRQHEAFIDSFWITWPKFIFAGWIILLWLVSVVKRAVVK